MSGQEALRKDDLFYASVSELSGMLRARKITSKDLTLSCIDRIRQLDGKLNAFVTVTEELAIEQAERADREIRGGTSLGPLHGIPYGAKDLLATKGIRTTWGSVPFKDQMFDEDATVIKRLEKAGAVLVA